MNFDHEELMPMMLYNTGTRQGLAQGPINTVLASG